MRRLHPGHGGSRRSGMISVAVLVCLLVMTLICGSLLRLVHSQRALVRNQERTLQADWLAESALERAVSRLGSEPAYRGETWTLSAFDLGGQTPAVVIIKVEPLRDPAESNRRQVMVQADFPIDAPQRIRSRRQAIVDISPGPAGAAP
jgi:hypothetical protein